MSANDRLLVEHVTKAILDVALDLGHPDLELSTIGAKKLAVAAIEVVNSYKE